MALAASPMPPSAGRDRLAQERDRFLSADPVATDAVRAPILASWWRSRQCNVAADRIELVYVRDPNLDTPLTRSAMPVLRSLHRHLDGQPVSVILTDTAGVVLTRLTADHDLERHLDRVQLAPGFSYAEQHVGTNGIGTAIEGGRPAHVFGHEHYAEDLEDLACAGVPIHDPVSGKMVGAVDLTCWRKDADALLIALAKATADQITSALRANASAREIALLQEYLRVCRRSSGIVLALGNDVLMMNELARQALDPAEQATLIGHAAEAFAAGDGRPVSVELPTGRTARLSCRLLPGRRDSADGVVQVKLAGAAPGRAAAEPTARATMCLPGLVGSGPLWLRACRQVEGVYDSGEWLAVEGEAGVGKLAVLRAVHQRRNPAGRFLVLDAADADDPDWLASARRELLERTGTAVIRHVDALGARQAHALSHALQEARAADREGGLWVAATLNRARARSDPAALLRSFPSTVELPPLRHHIDDLRELTPFFLAKLSQHARLTCSAKAMQILLRSQWPGNTEQVWQVLKQVARLRRAGAIEPGDLPAECWTVSRRLLSPLESMERDAIVEALLACGGNKAKAAESLGMSRATIYRKIHEYGVLTAPA